MKKSRGLLFGWIALTVAGTVGCGEVAYKTGAGADALRADRMACEQGGNAGAGYLACMREKGWVIADLDDAHKDSGGAAASEVPAPKLTVGGQTAAPAAQASAQPPDQKPIAAAPPGPVPVSGWIRFGGGGPQDDIAGCVVTLGPANQPDPAAHTATRALIDCMREKGWRAL